MEQNIFAELGIVASWQTAPDAFADECIQKAFQIERYLAKPSGTLAERDKAYRSTLHGGDERAKEILANLLDLLDGESDEVLVAFQKIAPKAIGEFVNDVIGSKANSVARSNPDEQDFPDKATAMRVYKALYKAYSAYTKLAKSFMGLSLPSMNIVRGNYANATGSEFPAYIFTVKGVEYINPFEAAKAAGCREEVHFYGDLITLITNKQVTGIEVRVDNDV